MTNYEYQVRKTDHQRYTKPIAGFVLTGQGKMRAASPEEVCKVVAAQLGIDVRIDPAENLDHPSDDPRPNLMWQRGVVLGDAWARDWQAWHLETHVVLVRPSHEYMVTVGEA